MIGGRIQFITQPLDRYLGVWDDAVHFEKLLIRVSLGDVKLPHHGGPVALTTAAADVKEKIPECSETNQGSC